MQPISNASSPSPASPACDETPRTIKLSIQGLGHVPSFKNMKRASRNGLFTEPRAKRWMRACTDSFALQLLCAFRTIENATPTGRSRPSWIASSMPLDDSVQWIPEISIRVELVEEGKEGAEILIERL